MTEEEFHGKESAGELRDDEEQLDIDKELEKRLVRKLDVHIIPIIMLLYLLSFLDRYARPWQAQT